MNVKSPNNTSKWQMGFNSAFKGLMVTYNYFVMYKTLRDVQDKNTALLEHKETKPKTLN
jgi:hypothetical protein